MNAVTRTGTTVKRLMRDVKSVTSGSILGIPNPPLINFTIEIPTVITTNATARATDKADVKLKESETIKRQKCHHLKCPSATKAKEQYKYNPT